MGRSGFGLIELLLVVAIIGILAGIVLSAASLGRVKAHDVAIENAVRQIRWQAEIAHNDNQNSYLNWEANPLIAEELGILMREIDMQLGNDPTDSNFVAHLESSQATDFCVSAPTRSDPASYYCIDGRGEIRLSPGHCPEYSDTDPPLRCP